MPSYDYACDVCGHLYNEYRSVEESQFVVKCPVQGCSGTLIERK